MGQPGSHGGARPAATGQTFPCLREWRRVGSPQMRPLAARLTIAAATAAIALASVPGGPGAAPLHAAAAATALGGINVEPSARPWHYVGANPDSWWCPAAS